MVKVVDVDIANLILDYNVFYLWHTFYREFFTGPVMMKMAEHVDEEKRNDGANCDHWHHLK